MIFSNLEHDIDIRYRYYVSSVLYTVPDLKAGQTVYDGVILWQKYDVLLTKSKNILSINVIIFIRDYRFGIAWRRTIGFDWSIGS